MGFSKEAAGAVRAFINCEDLLESKRLVEGRTALLLSDDAEACFAIYLERFGGEDATRQTICYRRDLLRACRAVGIDLAFARSLLSLHPEPAPDEVVAALGGLRGEDGVQALLAAHPEWTAPLQRLVVGGQLLEALLARMQDPAFAAGRPARVELCRTALELADRRVHPVAWAGLTGELANALVAAGAGDVGERLAEAERLYGEVLEHYEEQGEMHLVAKSHHNLGQALVTLAGGDEERARRGRQHLERALELRPRERVPLEWAQTRLVMAQACLEESGTPLGAGVEAAQEHARAALEVLAVNPQPALEREAVLTLAKALRAQVGDARTAVLEQASALLAEALGGGGFDGELHGEFLTTAAEWARETRNGRAAPRSSASSGTGFEGIECLTWSPGDTWQLVAVNEAPGFFEANWVPCGETLANWSELLTVEALFGAQYMSRESFLVARRALLEAQVQNGNLTWDASQGSRGDYGYAWTLEDDFSRETQTELVRVVPGTTGLHLAHWARRGLANDVELGRVRQLLASARPTCADPLLLAGRVASAPETETAVLQSRIERLGQEQEPGPPPDAAAFVAANLEGVQRSTNPELWASLQALSGLYLLRCKGARSAAHVEQAIVCLQRSLEIWTPVQHTESFLGSVRSLSRAFELRSSGDALRNRQQAEHGCRLVIQTCEVLGRAEERAEALHHLGVLLARGAGDDLEGITESARAIVAALDVRTPERLPEAWSESMLTLGDVFQKRAAVSERKEDLRTAERCYEEVLERLASSERFAELEVEELLPILATALDRLRCMDRAGLPQPPDLAEWRERPRRGHALYLRPLITSGDIVLANGFRETDSLELRFPKEPETLTLEAALYRVLAAALTFSAVAGRADGLGGTRWFSIGGVGWKDIVLTNLESAALVLMMPHGSPGVRWEIQTLVERRLLDRVVLLMPPEAPGFDVSELWAGAVPLMQAFGCELPEYEPRGALLRLAADGAVAERIPFDAVWDNNLLERLEPMLAANQGAGASEAGLPRA